MKRPLLLSLICLFLSLSHSIAQSSSRPGYIVTLDGDTVSGQVYYRSDKQNYEACRFIHEGEVKEFAPMEYPLMDAEKSQAGPVGGLMVSRDIGQFETSLIVRYYSMSNLSTAHALRAPTQKVGMAIQVSRR